MENGAEALLIAFAVLIFIIALSVSFVTLAQAKSTADVVLFYSDKKNFQTPLKDDIENIQNGGRTVGIDIVIATVYKCKKENFVVTIMEDDEEKYHFEAGIKDFQTNEDKIDKDIASFVSNYVNGKNSQFRETYVEVNTGGTINRGEDGETLEQDAWKRMYITYEILK